MKNILKNISPVIFGMMIICFFLPFVEISCGGQKIMSFTGLQMVTGTTIQEREIFSEETKSRKVDPEPLAIITFLCVIIGLLLSFIKNRGSAILRAVSAGIGVIMLLLLKSKIDKDVLKEGEGILQVEYGFGFWAILILLIIAVGLNIYIYATGDITSENKQVASLDS